jgi:hypothetical protein
VQFVLNLVKEREEPPFRMTECGRHKTVLVRPGIADTP